MTVLHDVRKDDIIVLHGVRKKNRKGVALGMIFRGIRFFLEPFYIRDLKLESERIKRLSRLNDLLVKFNYL